MLNKITFFIPIMAIYSLVIYLTSLCESWACLGACKADILGGFEGGNMAYILLKHSLLRRESYYSYFSDHLDETG